MAELRHDICNLKERLHTVEIGNHVGSTEKTWRLTLAEDKLGDSEKKRSEMAKITGD